MADTGLFDDLVPASSKPQPVAPKVAGGGLFDDLVPEGKLPSMGPTSTASVSPSPIRAEQGSVAQPTFSDPMTGFMVGSEAPSAPAVRAPATEPELRAWQPSLWEQFTNLIPGNRAKAANEYAARQIAKEKGISVDQVYRDAGGSRPIFNPEGQAPVGAAIESGKVVASEIPEIPRGTANATLRAVRGGNIKGAQDQNWLDRAITATDRPQEKSGPGNYDSFKGLGDSFGYSLTTMVSSAVSGTLATMASGGNVPVGVGAGMATSGTVAYRSSKDQFLSNLREKLNKSAEKVYGRQLTDAEWQQAAKDFDTEAMKYGAWEAVPEAISNAIFLKAFKAPAANVKGARLAQLTEKAASIASENITETATALGQNAAELRAGLTKDELTMADAFRQQFIQTNLLTAGMAGGMKGKELATKFYNEQVLPRVSPESALAKAIKADLEAVGFTPQGINQAAVNALNPDNAQLREVQRPQGLFDNLIPKAKPGDTNGQVQGQGQETAQVLNPTNVGSTPTATVSEPPITVQAGPGFNANNIFGALIPQGPLAVSNAEPPVQQPDPVDTAAVQPAPAVTAVEPTAPVNPVGIELTGKDLYEAQSAAVRALIQNTNTPDVTIDEVDGPYGKQYQVKYQGQVIATTDEKPRQRSALIGHLNAVREGDPDPQRLMQSLMAFAGNKYQQADPVAKNWLEFNGFLLNLPGYKGNTKLGEAALKLMQKMPANVMSDPAQSSAYIMQALEKAKEKVRGKPAAPAVVAPAAPAAVEPTIQNPSAVTVLNSLIDTMNGRAPTAWIAAHGLSETRNGGWALSARGQQLVEKLNPVGLSAKPLTTQEAEEIIAQFVAANPAKPVEPTAAPAPAEPTVTNATNNVANATVTPEVQAVLDRIMRYATIADFKLANGQTFDMEYLQGLFTKQSEGKTQEEIDGLLKGTENTMRERAEAKVWDQMVADYRSQFGNLTSEQQLIKAVKDGAFDISQKPYAAAAYELYKINPDKIQRQEKPAGVEDDVAEQLARFRAGNFAHRGGVAGIGAQGKDAAKAANDRYTVVYDEAAKLFLEGPLTAKTPGKRDTGLDFEHLKDIVPQGIPKKIVAKPDGYANQIKTLDPLAAKGDIRYYLNGFMLDRPNNRIVVTDGHRLAIINNADLANAPSDPKLDIVGRDGKFLDGKFPDVNRVNPGKHYQDKGTFNATELGDRARGIVQAWKYSGSTTSAVMELVVGPTKAYFQAQYIADMADAMRRMGSNEFQVSLKDEKTPLYATSADGRMEMVVMPMRDNGSHFAAVEANNQQELAPAAAKPTRAKKAQPEFERMDGQEQNTDLTTEELDDGATTDQPGRPARRATEGGLNLEESGQNDEGLGVAGVGTSSPSPNTRGTRVGQFVQQVSFTNRESFYREAFRAAGFDPAVANNLPIERQWNILAKLMEDTFGLKFVDKTPRANNRKAVDEMLDLYRNLQFMMAALELPLKTIGLEGSLGIVSMEKQPYFAVYYPQGLVLNARPTKAMPQGKQITGPFVGLPNRTNSFAHEWGHAMDFWLQDKIGKNHKGGVSGAIRDIGMSETPSSSERAFVDLINALFFDQNKIAARILDLERRIATTQSENVRQNLQKQLDAIKAGNSQVSDRSEYYRKVQQLGNDAYYLKPTEMIARSFETFISHKVEGIGGGTEAITKSLSAYNNDSVEYMQNAYPQQAERDKINLAWQNLIDALRAEAILGKPGDQIAARPGNLDIIDPNEMLKIAPDTRSMWQREVDSWRAFQAEGRRNDARPKNTHTVLQRYQNTMSSLFWSERGTLLTLAARYPNSRSIREVTRRLTTDPGSSSLNNRLTFEEATDRQVKRFSVKVAEVIRRYNLEKLEPEQMESLRRLLVSQPDGKATPELVEAADKIRNIFNEAWYYGDNAGLKMGYAANAYLPRMPDMAKIDTDKAGFVKAASNVYEVMFDNKFENFDTEESQLIGVLNAGIKLQKAARRGLPPFATGLDPDEVDALSTAIKLYKVARADAKAVDKSDDPDIAQAKADESMQKAVDAVADIYESIKRADSELNAARWLENMMVGGSITQVPGASPDADFLKGRVLPPEADVLMKDYLANDVLWLMMDYLPKLVRRAEYERRFGGTKLDQLKRQMNAEGVMRSDIDLVEMILAKLSGAVYDNSMGTAAKTIQTVQALGIMAMLGRAVLSSVAEPMGAAIQTRDVRDAFRSMGATLGAFWPSATTREREELAAAIGLIGDPHMDTMLSNREGGQFQDDPNMSKRMAKYYIFTLQHQWITKTSMGAMVVSQGFLRERIRTFTDSKNADERNRAMRDLKELGLQQSDVAQFVQWMNDLDENGESIMSGRKVTLDDLNSDMGELYSEMVYRMTRKIILDPKPTDTAALSKTTVGRAVMSIQSFAYTFQRQFLIATYKKIMEEYKSSKDLSQVSRVAGGVALGFASLIAGQMVISMLRELIFNPDRWEEKQKEGDLTWYLLKMGWSRAGMWGAWDPVYNLAEGIKYQRDLATTAVGAVPGYFFQALQRIITPFVRNSEKTNTAEYNATVGAYELAAVPLMAWGMTTLPAGPITAPVMAALYATATSPKVKNDVAEAIWGPKPKKGESSQSKGSDF